MFPSVRWPGRRWRWVMIHVRLPQQQMDTWQKIWGSSQNINHRVDKSRHISWLYPSNRLRVSIYRRVMKTRLDPRRADGRWIDARCEDHVGVTILAGRCCVPTTNKVFMKRVDVRNIPLICGRYKIFSQDFLNSEGRIRNTFSLLWCLMFNSKLQTRRQKNQGELWIIYSSVCLSVNTDWWCHGGLTSWEPSYFTYWWKTTLVHT